VNISTVGASQVIDPTGRTIEGLAAGTAGHMVTEVELRNGATPSVALGGAVPLLIVLGALLGLILAGVLARRRSARAVDEAG
jgi:apolipoprotein N-acyltransferase